MLYIINKYILSDKEPQLSYKSHIYFDSENSFFITKIKLSKIFYFI